MTYVKELAKGLVLGAGILLAAVVVKLIFHVGFCG